MHNVENKSVKHYFLGNDIYNIINVVRFIIINSVKALQKSKWLFFLFTSFVGGVGLLLMLIGRFGGLECDGGRSFICMTCCLKERKRHQY